MNLRDDFYTKTINMGVKKPSCQADVIQTD